MCGHTCVLAICLDFLRALCSPRVVTVRAVLHIVLVTFFLSMLRGSKLGTLADLPGFRNPFLYILEKLLRSLQGLRTKSVT
jgi:hypothetical protein